MLGRDEFTYKEYSEWEKSMEECRRRQSSQITAFIHNLPDGKYDIVDTSIESSNGFARIILKKQ